MNHSINTLDSASIGDRALTTVGERPHILFIDGMRGLAALYVCVSHVWIYPGSEHQLPAFERVMRFLMGGGHCAVNVFIALSGYCLMLPYVTGKRVDATGFLFKRALRILPPYFLCLVISAILGLTWLSDATQSSWDETLPVDASGFISHLLLVHDWFASASGRINYALWSIGVEWKIYFLFPLLVTLGRRYSFVKVALVATVVSYAIWFALYRLDWLNPDPAGSSIYYVGLFASGMATAIFIERVRAAKRKVDRRLLALFMVCAAVGTFIVEFKHSIPTQYGSLFGGLFACGAIIWLSVARVSLMRHVLASRPATFLGRISYSLYLIHPPVLQLVWVYVLHRDDRWTMINVTEAYATSVVATLVSAYVFYLIIERPSIRWTRMVPTWRSS